MDKSIQADIRPIVDEKTTPISDYLVYREVDKTHPKYKIANDICKNVKTIDLWNRVKDDSNDS